MLVRYHSDTFMREKLTTRIKCSSVNIELIREDNVHVRAVSIALNDLGALGCVWIDKIQGVSDVRHHTGGVRAPNIKSAQVRELVGSEVRYKRVAGASLLGSEMSGREKL